MEARIHRAHAWNRPRRIAGNGSGVGELIGGDTPVGGVDALAIVADGDSVGEVARGNLLDYGILIDVDDGDAVIDIAGDVKKAAVGAGLHAGGKGCLRSGGEIAVGGEQGCELAAGE